MLFAGLLSLVSFLIATVSATGRFLSPSGADGSVQLTEGDVYNIAWTDIEDYDIFSMGYYSSTNQTITWLISNSKSQPTSWSWTVNPIEKGFNLQDSKMFHFYACKDFNFSSPFISPAFVVNDKISDSSSSTTSSVTSTSGSSSSRGELFTTTATCTTSGCTTASDMWGWATATSTDATVTPSSSNFSSGSANAQATSANKSQHGGISTGAVVGIVIAVVIVLLGLAATVIFLRRRARQRRFAQELESHPSSTSPQDAPFAQSAGAYGKSRTEMSEPKALFGASAQEMPTASAAVHEMGAHGYQLPSTNRTDTASSSVGRSNFPSTHERSEMSG